MTPPVPPPFQSLSYLPIIVVVGGRALAAAVSYNVPQKDGGEKGGKPVFRGPMSSGAQPPFFFLSFHLIIEDPSLCTFTFS